MAKEQKPENTQENHIEGLISPDQIKIEKTETPEKTPKIAKTTTQKPNTETPKPNQKKETITEKKIPMYIIGLLIVLGLAIGFAAYNIFITPEPTTSNIIGNNGTTTQQGFVKVFSVYSSKCQFCEKNTTLILSMQIRGVKMQVTNIDIESQQGQELLSLYSIESVPTTMIEKETIREYPQVYASLQGFKLQNGFYIMPEYNLDNMPHNKMFLEPVQKTGNTTELMLFLDIECEGCRDAFNKSLELKEKFGKDLNISYKHFTNGGSDTESESIAIASECAKIQGKQSEFLENAFKFKYEDQNKTIEIFPSDVLFLGKKIGFNGLSLDDFIECFGNKQTKNKIHNPRPLDYDQNIGTDISLAYDYFIGKTRVFVNIFIPAFVIDNQFVTKEVTNIEQQLCSVRELEACKQ